jgi:hypothetical protein
MDIPLDLIIRWKKNQQEQALRREQPRVYIEPLPLLPMPETKEEEEEDDDGVLIIPMF